MSINSTEAYARFKTQSKALLDFTVLVSYAVPALREEIDTVKSGQRAAMLPPDFFHKSSRSTTDDLLKAETGYEGRLASYVLLTYFSFFESYVVGVVQEMIKFHGGESQFLTRSETRSKQFLAPHAAKVARLKRKLQDSEKPGWRQRYTKYARQLAEEGFRFPGELFAAYGVRNLILKLKQLKAFEIPNLLVEALRMNLSADDIRKFNEIRKIRNDIAHGEPVNLSMKESIQMNGVLRNLAIRISRHLTENFLVIEKYAP